MLKRYHLYEGWGPDGSPGYCEMEENPEGEYIKVEDLLCYLKNLHFVKTVKANVSFTT